MGGRNRQYNTINTRRNALCLNILYHIGGRVVDFLQHRVRMRVRGMHENQQIYYAL